MTQTTAYEHLVTNEGGVALIKGMNMKVVGLVLKRTAYGWRGVKVCARQPARPLPEKF